MLGWYSYLLGMYLGDGGISSGPRGVFRLRVTLDRRYPKLVAECATSVRNVVPHNSVSIYDHSHQRVSQVSAFSKHFPCLFPQHGAGKKHQRRIHLTPWQDEIVELHPWRFLRGLIHSDGCRCINTIRHPRQVYRYPRYHFANRSADIRGLFCLGCDLVGVDWRQSNRYEISVARRRSVALMDRYIGPKA